MAVTTARVSVSSGSLFDADDINSIAGQGIQVFSTTSARDAAFGSAPAGVVWISTTNELQWYDGSTWLTLDQGLGVGAPRAAIDTPTRCDDSVVLPNWGRLDSRVTIPAALSVAPLYPAGRLPNPFRFDPIPTENVFDNQTTTGGVLEFGQTHKVSVGLVRELTAAVDVEVHIVLVARGSNGTSALDRSDYPRLYLATGGGGGGEIAETHLRLAAGESLRIHGQHLGNVLMIEHHGRVILHVGRGVYSPGNGARQEEAKGGGYTAVGNALRPTPTPDQRYGYPVRVGGLAYESGESDLTGDYGTAGSGASFTADGNPGRWRGQWRTRPRVDTPVPGPVGVTLSQAHWKLTGNGATLEIGNGGGGYRTIRTDEVSDPDHRARPVRYGEGGAGGYRGDNATSNLPRFGPFDGAPGACLIRYPKPGTPLIADPVLP